MSEAMKTRDHKVIRNWAEQRGGRPAHVKETANAGDAGILRLDFEPADEGLVPLDWDEFFRKFDDAKLNFLYQDTTEGGKKSRFHKFVRD